MSDIPFRCSSLGRLMTSPTAAAIKAGEVLSVGAKTFVRQLAAEEIFGVTFEVSSKQIEKGIAVESEGIELLNRVRGLSLQKNFERKTRDGLTGECDLFDAARRVGYDIKCPWSVATFPIAEIDCIDGGYEWQCRGYLALWDADEWEVNYCLLDTPEHLIGYEPMQLHIVSHIPEHLRLTSWLVKRDPEKEKAIFERIKHARTYYEEVIAEFDRSHEAMRAANDSALPLAA